MTWRDRLTAPPPESRAERDRLIAEAEHWRTGAVGELRPILEARGYHYLDPWGSPEDAELRRLGERFSFFSSQGAYAAALAIYEQISRLPGPTVREPRKDPMPSSAEPQTDRLTTLAPLLCDRSAPQHYLHPETARRYWSISQVLDVLTGDALASSPVLDAASDRGTDVHAICGLLLGASVDRCAEPVIPDAYLGYVQSYRRWMQQAQPVPVLIEQPSLCPSSWWPYAGTPDALVEIGRSRVLVEVKTGGARPEHRIQVAAQWRLHGYRQATKAILLYLDEGGGLPSVVPVHRDPRDWAAFTAALSVLQWRARA